MKPTPTAYLVGAIDKTTGMLKGVGVFSEEKPTGSFRLHQVTLLVGYGVDYAEGLKQVRAMLGSSEYAWLLKFLDDRERRYLGL